MLQAQLSPNTQIPEALDNDLWIVVKSVCRSNSPNNGYPLQQGDQIRLGKVRLRVKLIMCDAIPASKRRENSMQIPQNSIEAKERDVGKPGETESVTSKNQITCRICLGEPGEDDNPFISPCACAGTMKYVHVKCLQYWLASKLTTKKGNAITSIVWKAFDCELCKKQFPSIFTANGQKYDSIDIPAPSSKSYIILEHLGKDKSQPKGYHIIDLAAQSVIHMVFLLLTVD